MITVRILQKEDTEAFRQLRLESFREAPLAFSESYEDEKERSIDDFYQEITSNGNPPEYYVLGAFNMEEGLIGFVKFKRDLRSKARHKSMIYAMYTKASERNKGIGKLLLEEVIRRARAMKGLEQIHLWVLHADRSVSGFYQRIGFISQGPYVKKDLKVGNIYVDAAYMVLYL